jgi:uncharacterized membrane protein
MIRRFCEGDETVSGFVLSTETYRTFYLRNFSELFSFFYYPISWPHATAFTFEAPKAFSECIHRCKKANDKFNSQLALLTVYMLTIEMIVYIPERHCNKTRPSSRVEKRWQLGLGLGLPAFLRLINSSSQRSENSSKIARKEIHSRVVQFAASNQSINRSPT